MTLGEVHDNIIDTNDNDPKPWADLDEMKRNMDAKFEAKLPSNIEPGFEDQFKGKLRSKRQSYGGSFDDELTCDPKFLHNDSLQNRTARTKSGCHIQGEGQTFHPNTS